MFKLMLELKLELSHYLSGWVGGWVVDKTKIMLSQLQIEVELKSELSLAIEAVIDFKTCKHSPVVSGRYLFIYKLSPMHTR